MMADGLGAARNSLPSAMGHGTFSENEELMAQLDAKRIYRIALGGAAATALLLSRPPKNDRAGIDQDHRSPLRHHRPQPDRAHRHRSGRLRIWSGRVLQALSQADGPLL